MICPRPYYKARPYRESSIPWLAHSKNNQKQEQHNNNVVMA